MSNRCLSAPFTKRNVLTFGEVETETPGHLADERRSVLLAKNTIGALSSSLALFYVSGPFFLKILEE